MGKTLKAIIDSLMNSLFISLFTSPLVNVAINSNGGEFGLYDTLFFGAGITLASTLVQFPFYENYYSKKERKKKKFY